jgi:nucleotide-binding universal stress UspA family protein
MAPLAGAGDDDAILAAAAAVAGPFGAELVAVYAPPDIADVMPWISDGLVGGVQTAAVESLKDAVAAGEKAAQAAFDACGHGRKSFIALQSPVRNGLATECRLSDAVVFTGDTARGQGPLAEVFEQIMVDEQRPVIIARPGLKFGGVAAVAWDGGKEASRAARLATPFLEKASRIVIIGAPKATAKRFELELLADYYAARGLKAEVKLLNDATSPKALLDAACAEGADLLAAGAFGHTRLREVIFGGATRTFLNSDQPSLFLSH